jgi:hypothetical protein
MIVEPCSIRDLEDVSKIASEFCGKDMFLPIRAMLLSSYDYVFKLNDTSVILFNPVDFNKFSIHLIGKKISIKSIKDFAILTVLWMFYNTKCESVLMFGNKSNKPMIRFFSAIGAVKSGSIVHNNGVEDLIYVYTKGNIEKYKERLSWNF